MKDMMENEKADFIFDLRTEVPEEAEYSRLHSPFVDDAEHHDESIKKSIDHVVEAYNEGKKVYFHCAGAIVLELLC
ncbi:hypothetical protein [Peribacillus simplex]|uniref:hypothetical protein n=1 Tax=Peribacillus simplex TaxID=1478 RepID=UPI0032DF62EB